MYSCSGPLDVVGERIDQALKQQRALEAKKIEGEFQDHIASVQETGQGRPGLRQRVSALRDPEALAEFDSQTAWARKYHETMTAIRYAPPEQVQEVMAQITPQAGRADFRQLAALHDEAVKVLADRFGALSGDIRDHAASLQATGEGIAGLRDKVAAFSPDHLEAFDAMERQSRQLFEAFKVVQSGSSEEVQQALSDLQPQSGPGFEAQQRMHAAVRKAVIDRQKALVDDPFAFAAQSPGVSTREDIIALQKTMGVEDYSYMSNAEAAEQVKAFKAAPDDQKVLLMQQWVKDAGKHRKALMRDLAAAGLPPAVHLLIGHANDPEMFAVLDRVFAAESQGFAALTRNATEYENRALRRGVAAALEPYRSTLLAASGHRSTEFANATQDIVLLLAAAYMAEGRDAGVAATLAAKQIINNHFTFVRTYRVPNDFDARRVVAYAKRMRAELPDFGVVMGVGAEPGTVLGRTSEGRPIIVNNDGGLSTELLATVVHPDLNDGRPTNIPTIFNGEIVSEDDAVRIVIEAGGIDPQTGRTLDSFDSVFHAAHVARERARALGDDPDVQMATRKLAELNAGVVPREIFIERLMDEGDWATLPDESGLVFMTQERVPAVNSRGEAYMFPFEAVEEAGVTLEPKSKTLRRQSETVHGAARSSVQLFNMAP